MAQRITRGIGLLGVLRARKIALGVGRELVERMVKVAKVALASGDQNEYAFAWQNPESSAIIVRRVLVDVTTAAGAAATMDVGTANDATTNGDNLLDGVDINSVHVVDNIDDQSTEGESKQKMDEKGGTTDHITGQILSDNAGALAGNVYIEYVVV